MATPSTVSFAATATFDLEAKAADGAPRRPTFAINGYTGAVMNVAGFYTPVIVDLGGIKASGDTMPVLLDHDTAQIVGQTDGVVVSSEGVDFTGTVMGEDHAAARVLSLARNGFRWQASIGASIVRQEMLKAGEKAQVNGREVTGPLLIARESRLFEISFVAIGADGATSASVAASSTLGLPLKGESTMTPFEQWLKAKGFDPAALNDAQKSYFQARYDEETKANAAVTQLTGSLDDIVSKHETEIERQSKIKVFLDKAMANRPDLISEFKKLGEIAIENKAKFDEVELQTMRLERTRGYGSRFVKSERRIGAKLIEATVARSLALKDLGKHYDQETLNASDDMYPRGMGLRDLLLAAARENGYSGYSTSDPRPLLEAAFPARGHSEIRAEGVSTLSLPGIMSNVANKFLLQGFNSVESSWREVAAIGSARDFKTFYSYNFLLDAMFSKVGPGGELEHATASELEYTNRVETYGKMFAVTRQDIINDNLGALQEIPMRLGRGAAIGLNMTFWTEFLADLNTFYTSGRGNVSTGAGSALSSDGLKAAQLKFMKQTDPNGDPLAVDPRVLLVPPELEITADELMTSLIVNTGGASTETKVPNRNVWANKYRKVVSRYLSNANITGYSTAAWWLISDPMDLPLIQVAFLNGRQEPVVESADLDFNTLGVQFRGYFDVGVKKQEYRSAVRSAGS